MNFKHLLVSLCFLPSVCFAQINTIGVIGSDQDTYKNQYIKNTTALANHLSSQKKQVLALKEFNGLNGALIKAMVQRNGSLKTFSYQNEKQETCPDNFPCTSVQTEKTQAFEDAIYQLIQKGDGVVFLPGGFSVMYAFNYLQVLSNNKEINYKPVLFLNTNHYFDRLRQMLVEMNRQNVISNEVLETIVFENRPENVLKVLQQTEQKIQNLIKQKKL